MIYPFNAEEVYKISLNIEENGYRFYQEAAERPFPETIKRLFIDLGEEELKHKALFASYLDELPKEVRKNTVWDPHNDLDMYLKAMADEHVFFQDPSLVESRLKDVKGPAEAVRMAMMFERDTIVFFLELMNASDGLPSQNKIQTLVNEERGHLKKLTNILQQVTSV